MQLQRQLERLKSKKMRLSDPNAALTAISKFIADLVATFEGRIEGASKIGFIFGSQWPRTLDSLQPAEGVDLRGLEIALKNSKVRTKTKRRN